MNAVTNHVELLAYTKEPEQVITTAAKLCYSDKNVDEIKKKAEESDNAKFINMLMSVGHVSTIEHASFTFSIEGVSRSLLAQLTRHRIASFSVKSQRYVSEAGGFNYIVPPSIKELGADAEKEFCNQMDTMSNWYKDWQEKLGGSSEKANEDARFVLPNACETKLIMTMNARELSHFFSLRCCNRAQWEIREVAWKMLELVYNVAPNLFSKSAPDCVFSACSEGKKCCKKQQEMKDKINKIYGKI